MNPFALKLRRKVGGFITQRTLYIEKMIVVALSVFLFYTLLLYGGSTAAEFVNYPQGAE